MHMKHWISKLVVSLMIVAYLFFMPEYLDEALEMQTYDEKFSAEEEAYTGILTVWHVVGFKPYSGSMGTTLASIAKDVERAHYGVFFDVIAMDEAEYMQRTERGEVPDIISFPIGLCYPEQLSPLAGISIETLSEERCAAGQWNEIPYALPYAMSAHVLLINTALFQERGATLPEGEKRDATWIEKAAETFLTAQEKGNRTQLPALSGDILMAASLGLTGEVTEYDAFKSGKAAMAIADLRAANEMEASQIAGKGFSFEASALEGGIPLVQMIGLTSTVSDEKRPYALEFIECLFSEKAQKQFVQQGLIMPTENAPQAEDAAKLITSAAEYLCEVQIPNAFLLQRYQDALEENAQRALAGDEAAQKDLETRLKELVSST